MSFSEFLDNKKIQKAADAFVERFGGRFFGEEPGDRLVYETEDGEAAYTPPEGTTAEKVLQTLEGSVQREKSRNPILTLWTELEMDPEQDY